MAIPFQHYNLHYQSGGTEEALIQLFNAREFIANLTFHKEGTPLPPNVVQENGVQDVHYHISRFRDVLQILQYEKPLHIRVKDGVADLMASGFEPVGEQEGHGEAAAGGSAAHRSRRWFAGARGSEPEAGG